MFYDRIFFKNMPSLFSVVSVPFQSSSDASSLGRRELKIFVCWISPPFRWSCCCAAQLPRTLENSEKISSQNLFFFLTSPSSWTNSPKKCTHRKKNKEPSQKKRDETLRCCVLAALEHTLVWYVENSLCADHNLVEKPTTRTWLRLRHHNRTVQKQREIYQRGR